ncbi:MAG: hypothetical protein KJ793_00805 [Candidatus Omnitrophica bacterium]|nr:hypothetical protein [Candidatus Omnitrophota bacterium]
MTKIIPKKKFWLVIVFCLLFALPYQEAFARSQARSRGRDKGRQEVVVVKQKKYHYRDGRFYRPSWFGFRIVLRTPPIGAVVTFIPAGHRKIIFAGATYYHYDNIYYKSCPSGYVVVPAPEIKHKPGEKVTMHIPNENGSYTAVILVEKEDGYIGPQGEFYPGHPTLEQLMVLYGK